MTITDTDTDRLRSLVAELDRLLAGPGLQAAVNPDGTPGHVAAGELIESAWGNAVVDTLTRRVGVGVYTTNQAIATALVTIAWLTEAYDTDNFHVPSATDIVIPANRAGIYGCSLTMTSTTGVTAPVLVRLNVGGAVKQNTIITGQTIASVSYIGPLSVGQVITAACWNSGSPISLGSSLEVNRLAI